MTHALYFVCLNSLRPPAIVRHWRRLLRRRRVGRRLGRRQRGLLPGGARGMGLWLVPNRGGGLAGGGLGGGLGGGAWRGAWGGGAFGGWFGLGGQGGWEVREGSWEVREGGWRDLRG